MIHLRTAAFAAIAVACLSSATVAAPPVAGEVRVTYADLDLASVAGRAALDRRIAGAVRTACATGTTDVEAMAAAARCRAAIGRDTRAQVAALVQHRVTQVAAR